MKIKALCNSQAGIPTIQALAQAGVLAELGTSDMGHEGAQQVQFWANSAGIPLRIFSKSDMKNALPEWLQDTDCLVVATFPYKIPAEALEVPAKGCYNFHFAPLPAYRGPEPVFWTIRNMEAQGAVCIFKMDADWDTGPILKQHLFPFQLGETYGLYMSRAAMESANLIPEFLQSIAAESLALEPQNHVMARYLPRPDAESVQILWQDMSATQIHALVAACNPWNRGAATLLSGMPLKIIETGDAGAAPEGAYPGQLVVADPQQGMFAATKDRQLVEIRVVATDFGILTGARLCALGVNNQMMFS